MKDFATNYLKWFNQQSKVVKAVLCLLWDVPNNLARFCQSALKDNMVGMILAVVLGLFGGWILFLIDLVCLLIKDKIYWLDDLGLEEMTENLFKSEEKAAPAESDAKEEAPAVEAPEEAKSEEENN